MIKCYQTDEEEQVTSMDASQRAAGGGIAVCRTWSEWASEGELKFGVGEPENGLRYQREHMSVCMSGCSILRQAGWHRRSICMDYSSCPCNFIVWDKGFLFCTIHPEGGRRACTTGHPTGNGAERPVDVRLMRPKKRLSGKQLISHMLCDT